MKLVFKSLLLLFFLIGSADRVDAQNIGGSTSVWKYDKIGNIYFGQAYVKYLKDTLINDVHTSVYARGGIVVTYDLLDTMTYPQRDLFIQNNNGLVKYAFDELEFDTLYNFNGNVGDKYIWYDKFTSLGLAFDVEIIDNFVYELNNISYEGQVIEFDLRPHYPIVRDSIFSNFGSKEFYIIPYDVLYEGFDAQSGGLAMCYSDSLIGAINFINPGYDISNYNHNCDENIVNTVLDQGHEAVKANVFPNPSENSFYVEAQGVDFVATMLPKDVYVADLNGVSVDFELKFVDSSTLELELFAPPGMYFVRLNNLGVYRLVKLR